jgi:ornithine carbamoyltransferase
MHRLLIEVVQIYPEPWHVPSSVPAHPRFYVSTDMGELLDADVVITDCWPKDADPAQMQRYQVTASVLDSLGPRAEFLPCPPVTRG